MVILYSPLLTGNSYLCQFRFTINFFTIKQELWLPLNLRKRESYFVQEIQFNIYAFHLESALLHGISCVLNNPLQVSLSLLVVTVTIAWSLIVVDRLSTLSLPLWIKHEVVLTSLSSILSWIHRIWWLTVKALVTTDS